MIDMIFTKINFLSIHNDFVHVLLDDVKYCPLLVVYSHGSSDIVVSQNLYFHESSSIVGLTNVGFFTTSYLLGTVIEYS